jgi:putative ABC transport system permease protein
MINDMFDLDRWNEIFITISRNKMRSFLTAFGVFWGIFMLVALIGGGKGLETLISGQIEGVATNSCFMWSNRTSEAYKGFRKGRWWQLNNRDIEMIKANVKGIDEISPVIMPWSPTTDNAVRGEKKGTFSVQGNYANFDKIDKQTIKYGRFLNDMDIQEHRKVCFVGSRVYETLFNRGEDPIGQDIRVDGIYYKIIGVGEGSDAINLSGDKREMITIPFTTMQRLYNYGDNVDMLCAMAKPDVTVSEIQEQMETILKTNHSIAPHDKQAINSFNLETMFKQVGSLFLGVNILAWIVGFGTLFAGIIGVSNIMMVTVRERTQEIGIRRALGAKPSSIMTQIMSESFAITAIAGFLGISFAVLILQIVDLGLSTDGGATTVFQISFFTSVVSAFIIIILGTLAGLGPAFRAMKIKPIEALSEE